MKQKNFKLSHSGKLCLALGLAAHSLVAAGIDPSVNGPEVYVAGNGAAVINIVKPSSKGLSHNTYNDFNVDRLGAVFVNTKDAATSELAGKLQGNTNLDRGADVILNEVLGNNASNLNGKQEILGKSADYVLANKNGINCNDCGFINTNQNSLVVGQANVADGQLESLQATGNKQLNVNSVNGQNAVLNLIAPKINTKGTVVAKEINAISGHNKVNYKTKQVTKTDEVNQAGIDGVYLGAMQADRINIISTNNDGGVNLTGAFQANEFNADAAASLNVVSVVKSKDRSFENADKVDNYFNTKIKSTVSHNESVNKTNITAQNGVKLKAKDVKIVGSDLVSENGVKVVAVNLNVDAQKQVDSQQTKDLNKKLSWRHDVTTDKQTVQQHRSSIKAGSIELATQQASLNAVKLDSKGDVKISGEKVVLDGAIESKNSLEKGYQQNHTAKLLTGNWEKLDSKQNFVASEINAKNNIAINTTGDLTLKGALLNAGGSVKVQAAGTTNVDVAKSANISKDKAGFTIWGGLAGGESHNKESSVINSHVTTINAGSDVLLQGDTALEVTGAAIDSAAAAYAYSKNGAVSIKNAQNLSVNVDAARVGTIFNITKSSFDNRVENLEAKVAQLSSNDLTLQGNNVNVSATDINTSSKLQVVTTGDFVLSGANSTKTEVNSSVSTGVVKASENFSDGSILTDKQADLGVSFVTVNANKNASTESHVATNVNAGTIVINADDNASLSGANINSQNGVSINAANINLTSDNSSSESNAKTTEIGAGIGLTVSASKASLALTQTNKIVTEKQSSNVATGVNLVAGGDVNLTAGDKVKLQKTNLTTTGDYIVNAQEVLHTSAQDANINEKLEVNQNNKVSLAVNYGGLGIGAVADTATTIALSAKDAITKPTAASIIGNAGKVVQGIKQIIADGKAVVDNIKKANFMPEIEIGAKFDGNSVATNSTEITNQTSNINSKNASVTAANVQDDATKYTGSSLVINADNYKNLAVNDVNNQKTHTEQGSVALAVSLTPPTTPSPVPVKANVTAGGQHGEDSVNSVNAIVGQNNVNNLTINAQQTAVLEGTKVRSSNATISADKVEVNQAVSSKATNVNNYGAAGTLTVDAASIIGSGASVNANQQNSQAVATNGVGASLTNVTINAVKDLTLAGADLVGNTNLNSSEGSVTLATATTTQDVKNVDWNVGLNANAKVSVNAKQVSKANGGIGIDLNKIAVGNVKAISNTGTSNQGTLTINAAKDANLNSTQSQGDVTISSQNTNISAAVDSKKGNDFAINSNADAQNLDDWKKVTGVNNLPDFSFGVNLKSAAVDNKTHVQGNLTGSNLNVNSDKLAIDSNVVNVTNLNANVNNDIVISSKVNKVNEKNFSGGLNLNKEAVQGIANVVEEAKNIPAKFNQFKDEMKNKFTKENVKDTILGFIANPKAGISGLVSNLVSTDVNADDGIAHISVKNNIGEGITKATVNAENFNTNGQDLVLKGASVTTSSDLNVAHKENIQLKESSKTDVNLSLPNSIAELSSDLGGYINGIIPEGLDAASLQKAKENAKKGTKLFHINYSQKDGDLVKASFTQVK